MTQRFRWEDVERLVAEHAECEGDRRMLDLLTSLPFASAAVLAPFIGSRTTTYRILLHLYRFGLTDWIRPPSRPGHSPRLWYLTDLGVALVARYAGCAPRELAQR
jgi:hypothetical protein